MTSAAGHAEGPRIDEVQRIAVLRGNALGDLVVALPALEALRATYPAASITLLGRRHHAALLGSGRPSPVDRVVVLPEGAIGDEPTPLSPARRAALLDRLAAERFDLAIQLHGGGRSSNPFVRGLRARVSAGSRAPDAPPLDRWVAYQPYQWEVARSLEVVGLVGARPVGIEPRLRVAAEDGRRARRLLPAIDGAPYVVLHPGATDPRRRWPIERFAEVGLALAGAGRRVVITGTPGEARLTGALARALAGGRYPPIIADGLDVPALLGLLAHADLVVGNDTGPLHLAMAAGTPTVGVFWIGNLLNAGPATRARHRPLVSWQVRCPVCDADAVELRCEHDVSFVAGIPAGAAVDAASVLLEAA